MVKLTLKLDVNFRKVSLFIILKVPVIVEAQRFNTSRELPTSKIFLSVRPLFVTGSYNRCRSAE